MHNKTEMQLKSLKRKLIVIFSIFVIILLIMFAIYYYYIIQQNKFVDGKKTKQLVEVSGEMSEIVHMDQFYDEESYHIFDGVKNGKPLYIFVPLQTANEVKTWHIISKAKIMPYEDVKESFKGKCDSCKLQYIQPAMIDAIPLWEIAYIDNNDYVLDYISMENGDSFDSVRLKIK